jgi:hypothetical protein
VPSGVDLVLGKVDEGVRIGVVCGKVHGSVGEVKRSCARNLLVNPAETNLSGNFAVNPNGIDSIVNLAVNSTERKGRSILAVAHNMYGHFREVDSPLPAMRPTPG